MNVVEFNFNKFLEKDLFRINETIEPIYIELAEMVFSKLYKAYCFNPLYEGPGNEKEKKECLKSAIIVWADYFMDWEINNTARAKKTTNNMIFLNIYPTPGLFRAVYFNETIMVEKNIYKEYINYLYKFCFNEKDGKIHGADFFITWDRERTGDNKNIE